MAKEIKQKIVLSGEKEYSQALKDAQRNLKTLQTALKAETAELGANASAQDKARVKAASLKEQIAEQEKVVATLSAALGEVKEKYSDNEAEVARWEQKLNNARATLAGMKNDLAGTGEGFQAAEKGAAEGPGWRRGRGRGRHRGHFHGGHRPDHGRRGRAVGTDQQHGREGQ